MKEFIAGQKIQLQQLTTSEQINVGVQVNFPSSVASSIVADISCFGVDSDNQLSDDRYMIFYNQTSSPCGSISITNKQGADTETFALKLKGLPNSIKKLVFTATIDGNVVMNQMSSGYLRLADGNGDVMRFSFVGKQFNQEKAIIIGELYFKDVWRVGAVGQGFNGGLSALLQHYGGEEIGAPVAEPAPVKPAPKPPAAAEPATPKINLSKVTLEKKGDKQSICLEKSSAMQPIRVNLNWDGNNKKGFFGFAKSAPDLDLGCFYRMKNGSIGVIQPLGNSFGSKTQFPHIQLDKDDRSGRAKDGENLVIYRPDLVEFIVIFAMIYEGATDFTSVNGRLTIRDPKGNEVLIPLNAPDPSIRFCVAASFRNTGNVLDLTKEEKYFRKEHKEADQYYGFGFQWRAGSK